MQLTVEQYKALKGVEIALKKCEKVNLNITIKNGKIKYEELKEKCVTQARFCC